MLFKIFALRVDGSIHMVVPMKDKNSLGNSFDTKEEAEQAFNDADDLKIPSLDKPSGREYQKHYKNHNTYTIIETL